MNCPTMCTCEIATAALDAGWEKIIGEICSELGDYALLLDAAGTILSSSSGVTRTIGYRPDELSGRSIFTGMHPDDRVETKRRFDRLLAAGSGMEQAECRLRTAAGEYRWLELRLKNRQGDPLLKAVVAVCRDITGHKLIEEALACRIRELDSVTTDLERALRVKDEFLASMSHELRTPLTVIIGQAEILRDEIHGTLNDSQQQAVRSVESGGRHLLALINDILDLSRIEAAMLELSPEPINIERLCASSLMFVKQEAQRKRLAVSMTLDPAVSSVRADPRRVKQILVNLLANAVKFTPEGGEVGLDVSGDREQRRVRFTVWDTGFGIAAADLERLFTPFVQVGSSRNRSSEGSGLGLVLARHLARLHGGDVAVTSEVGSGSRFAVTLPWEDDGSAGVRAIPPTPAAAPEAGTVPCSLEAPLILVVDDSPAMVEMMQGYLRQRAFRVAGVTSGEEAVAAARSGSPALVIMDIQMPGMNGLEAINRIRRLPGASGGVPIIALTALAMRGDRERCLAAGADDYFSKPVSMKDLAVRISALLATAGEGSTHA